MQFGTPVNQNGETYAPLFEDLLTADTLFNRPFRSWRASLRHWNSRSNITMTRLDSSRGNMLNDVLPVAERAQIQFQVLWPTPEMINGQPMLPLLHSARSERFRTIGRNTPAHGRGLSASHTINGHSVTFRMTYGNMRMLFTGDLNSEAQDLLVKAGTPIESEILKVPHHGSDDFSFDFLKKVNPIASIVSSGDQEVRGDYMHPKVNLVGALGKASRVDRPMVFITELAAFIKAEGWVEAQPFKKKGSDWTDEVDMNAPHESFYAFRRQALGTVHVRTDGQKALIFTDSGVRDQKDAYIMDLTNPPNVGTRGPNVAD